MINKIINKLTNNQSEVLLFYATIDLHKYRKDGVKGSCDLKLHPNIADEKAKRLMEELVDHIRENYDMEDLI